MLIHVKCDDLVEMRCHEAEPANIILDALDRACVRPALQTIVNVLIIICVRLILLID